MTRPHSVLSSAGLPINAHPSLKSEPCNERSSPQQKQPNARPIPSPNLLGLGWRSRSGAVFCRGRKSLLLLVPCCLAAVVKLRTTLALLRAAGPGSLSSKACPLTRTSSQYLPQGKRRRTRTRKEVTGPGTKEPKRNLFNRQGVTAGGRGEGPEKGGGGLNTRCPDEYHDWFWARADGRHREVDLGSFRVCGARVR